MMKTCMKYNGFRAFSSSLLKLRALAGRVLLVGAVLFGTQSYAGEPVTIFAAASLKPALDHLFEDADPSDIQLVYGGSSAMARQIQFGAPADIFISANKAWMDSLEQSGQLQPETRMDLLGNRLILVAGAGRVSTGDLVQDLSSLRENDRLAMALANAVPAGIYGKAALLNMNLWDSLRPYVVQGDNVRAALRFVETGEVAFGIVYATDASAAVKIIDFFPTDSHPPIRYPIAMIKSANSNARPVYDFLLSAEAAAVFDTFGFETLAAQ